MGRKEKTILITIVANIILIILRFSLASLSGSIGLQANAWHSFTDVFVTSIVFIGLMVTRYGAEKLKFASKKAENILAIFVSLFIFYMGVEILSDALKSEQTELRYVPFVAAGAFVGVIINYFMARYKIYVGEQTGSESLMADGYHSKMDMYCSIAVLVGVIGSLFSMPDLDKVSAIVAMVLLMIAGYEIFTSNLRMLLHPEEVQSEHAHHHGFHYNKKMVFGISGLLVVSYFVSGVYIVNLDETGVVRRFGEVVQTNSQPGIHYNFPAPIGQVTVVKTGNIEKVETGQQELLSGDTNLVNINMSVHYRINNAANYILNVRNPDLLIQSSATTSIRQIVGERNIDYILTEGKEEIETAAMTLLKETMDKNNTGIEVVSVQLVQSEPPASVIASFQDLATARQDQSIYINQATSYKNTIIPQAKAEAYKTIAEAEGYQKEKIQTAEGDAALFIQKQEAYVASRSVTEFRLYMEAMEKVLPNVQKLLLGEGVKINNADLWLTKKPND
ncbi:FtsH protease activity modulator HflK [Anaerotignum sp.]|uniref:FtsH protease activity modulator HflK n=1 Tax=Anaerotignum sp. TaxID=2039241 RepID=UPI0028A0DD8C|nr:FtsH protease activity modulator HflK [Anaerotignum sp.]